MGVAVAAAMVWYGRYDMPLLRCSVVAVVRRVIPWELCGGGKGDEGWGFWETDVLIIGENGINISI
jgi:hypothetical protein